MWTDQQLSALLDELRRGPYRFAQLRHTPWDRSLLNGQDIDLLGDEAAVAAMIDHLYTLTLAGKCHVRIRRSNPDKTRLTIYSPDLTERIELDLWINLWQLNAGELGLRFGHVQDLLTAPGIAELPAGLEAAIYVQHLVTKQKDLSSPGVQRRLSHYAAARLGDLSGHFYRALSERTVSPEFQSLALKTVLSQIKGRPARRGLLQRIVRNARPFPRLVDASALAFIGCDGVGKTSVTEALVQRFEPGKIQTFLGKQLYRRSLTFRAAYKFNKASVKLASEAVDEKLAALAFSAARRALLRRLARHRGVGAPVLLLDRFLGDFLYVGRKADQAHFTRWLPLCRGKSLQCPIVHFVVPYDVLSQRKQEVTAAGQGRYDSAMLHHYTRADRATDYLLFCNTGTVDQAARALAGHVSELFATEGVQEATAVSVP